MPGPECVLLFLLSLLVSVGYRRCQPTRIKQHTALLSVLVIILGIAKVPPPSITCEWADYEGPVKREFGMHGPPNGPEEVTYNPTFQAVHLSESKSRLIIKWEMGLRNRRRTAHKAMPRTVRIRIGLSV